MNAYLRILTKARPCSICSCCDQPLTQEQEITVILFPDGRLEDYHTACAA